MGTPLSMGLTKKREFRSGKKVQCGGGSVSLSRIVMLALSGKEFPML
jgi:hypothetical protein